MDPIELDRASLPELLSTMSHADPELRGNAACAIGDRLRTRELDDLDADTRDKLAALLGDPVPMVRLEAAIALAEAHDERATSLLLSATRRHQHRLDAIRALGTLGDKRATEPLRGIMERRFMPWADRLQAAAALCALEDQGGADYLATRVTARRAAERAAAVHFLGESRHPEARRVLEAILRNPDHELRDTAARALGLLGDADAEHALRQARVNADESLRADIDYALSKLVGQGSP